MLPNTTTILEIFVHCLLYTLCKPETPFCALHICYIPPSLPLGFPLSPDELGSLELLPSSIGNDIPINAIPPRLQILLLLQHAPIRHVDMLPRVDTEYWVDIDASRRDLRSRAEAAVRPDGVDNRHVRHGLLAVVVGRVRDIGLGLGVHVLGLEAPVRAGIGRAGDVGGEQRKLALLGLDEPDEARPEHGVRGGDELAAQRLDGGEGGLHPLLEGRGHGGRGGGEGREEEVVVVRHGGVVEEGGHGGLAGIFDEEVLGRAGVVFGGTWDIVSRVPGEGGVNWSPALL